MPRGIGDFMGILSNYINGELGCMLRIYGVYTVCSIYIYIYLSQQWDGIYLLYIFVCWDGMKPTTGIFFVTTWLWGKIDNPL